MKKEKRIFNSRTRIPEDSPQYQFGSRLKERMKEKGITQDQLAEMLGVSSDTVKGWCQHYTFPEYTNLGKLCEIFRPYSIDYFYGIVDAPNYDMQFVSDFTGLTPEAVYALKSKTHKVDRQVISVLLEHLQRDFDIMKNDKLPADGYTNIILRQYHSYFKKIHEMKLIEKALNSRKHESKMTPDAWVESHFIYSNIRKEASHELFDISQQTTNLLDRIQPHYAESYLSSHIYFERNGNMKYAISENGISTEGFELKE